jgi:glycerol-3-phosphate dehydrogenase
MPNDSLENELLKSHDDAGIFYDIVIIGGGIHGAGVAQACSAAGYDCLLLEKNDWAWATSSRSSKLLHGGLRYLQTGQLKLVYECLQERELLLKNAPELAHINWFYLPIYRDSNYPSWKIFLGLSLYCLLTGFRNPHGKFRIIPRKEWATLNGLCRENLQAVFAYQDAQTDDKLLTQAVKNSAITLGCDAWQPAEMLAACKNNYGWLVDIHQNNALKTVNCQLLINTAGPWVNDIIQRCGRKRSLSIELVQGAHLILKKQISTECFYLEASDHRAVFVLPWHNKTLVGTTETAYSDKTEHTAPTEQEIRYLLNTVREHFPQANLDIDSEFSGLRVLPTSNQQAFFRSRDTQFIDDEGLISLYGGKLTAYRATAEKILALIQKRIGKRKAKADTHTLPLHRPQ